MFFHSAFALYGCILHLYFVCVNKIFIVFLYLSFLLVFYKILSEFSTFLLYTFSLAVARFPRQSGVKTRIHLIEVLTVQLILERLESFTESLEVYHMLSNISVIGSPLDWNSQELNGIPPADCGQIPTA